MECGSLLPLSWRWLAAALNKITITTSRYTPPALVTATVHAWPTREQASALHK